MSMLEGPKEFKVSTARGLRGGLGSRPLHAARIPSVENLASINSEASLHPGGDSTPGK